MQDAPSLIARWPALGVPAFDRDTGHPTTIARTELMLNTVSLIARLTADPELVQVGQTNKCVMRLACERRRGRDGADRGAVFVTVEAWNGQATSCAEHLTKGRLVAVRGRLEHEEWISPEGRRRERVLLSADEVEFLERPSARRHVEGQGTAA